MAHDHKVIKDLARSKEIFLREPPGFYSGPPKLYSVEEEFRKTKANRSPVVPLVVLGFVVVFATVAIVLTTLIDRAAKNVPIGIEEFQDINLTDILDRQKRNDNALKTARRDLDDLRNAEQEELRKAQDDADRRVEISANQAVAAAERDKSIRAIRAQEQAALGRIRADFAPRIAAKEAEITDIQAQVDAYDSRMVEQAKKSEEILDNQRRLFEAQREQLTSYYEDKIEEVERARADERRDFAAQKDGLVALVKKNHADEIARLIATYNPVYTESPVLDALARPVDGTQGGIAELPPFRPVLASEGIRSQERFSLTRSYLGDIAVLLERLRSTPYTNSVPAALTKIEELERAVVADYESLWTSLASAVERKSATIAERDATIRDRDGTIRELRTTLREREATIVQREQAVSQFTYALEAQTRSSRENGYILDPRSPRITVYVNSNIPLRDGTTAYVFRREDEPVATVELHREGGVVTARLVSLADPEKQIEPFDKLLVQLK